MTVGLIKKMIKAIIAVNMTLLNSGIHERVFDKDVLDGMGHLSWNNMIL